MNRRHFIRIGAAACATTISLPVALRAAPAMSDVAIVREALKLHPGLYRYQSPATFEQRFEGFAESWNRDTNLASRFLALSRFTAQVRCGHTQCNPYNQTDAVVAALFERKTRLPFAFRWLDGKMVVIGDSGTATGIAKGSIVKRLNGIDPAKILSTLVPFARADGHNDAKRVAQMEMRTTDEFETFDIYQGLLFPPPPEGHHVVWRDPAGAKHEALLPALGLADRQKLLPPEAGDGPLWKWAVRPDGIAVLTMPTWVTYHGKWDWEAWLTERFATLGNAKGLVIDLRDNEGGTDCGTFILQRLIDKPVKPVRYANRVTFREAPADVIPYLDTWDRSFRTLGKDAVLGADGFLTVPGDEDEWQIEPAGAKIPVPVAVLISPVNSSATFSFARRVREARAATLIGEPTGGNLRGINGGAYFFVRLPESGLEFDLPLKGYFPEGRTPPDAGVRPDIHVGITASAIASGDDPQLAAAIAHLLRK
jgi:Peptidase family S41